MSDKPKDFHPNDGEQPNKNDNSDFEEKQKDKPETQKPPTSGRATGILRSTWNWESLSDNKSLKSPLSTVSDNTVDTEEDKPTEDSSANSFFSLNNNKDKLNRNPDTAVLSSESSSWRKIIDAQTQGTTSTLGEQHEVLFVIRGMIERVVMNQGAVVILGRFDTGTILNEEIDLIPYGALDRGVSRRHCKIQLKDNQLYVTDLNSTNGTFLAGVRLKPNEETILRKGDELLLGRLSVQILFR